jgi:hypothetical protein
MLEKAVALAKEGDKDGARKLLRQIVAEDPHSEHAWGWLSYCAATNEEKIAALRRVVEINPDNELAGRALDRLTTAKAAQPTPSPPVQKTKQPVRQSKNDVEVKKESGLDMTGRYIALVGALLVAAGSFLPWVSINSLFGTISKNGIEGDGQITLALGVMMGIGLLERWKKAGRALVVGIIAIVVILVGVYEYTSVTERMAEVDSDFVSASVGVGLYMVIAGGALGFGAFRDSGSLKEPEPTKVCPQCAETVKAAAQVCRFCGYEFQPKAEI